MVDDEEPARRRLIRQLHALGAEVAGEADDGEGALRSAAALSPEVILLDIHMPGLDGLTLAQRYTHLPPIIFVTAHDDHALRAFEVNAVDYLLKPVRLERLQAALARAAGRAGAKVPGQQPALEAVGPSRSSTRIVTTTRGAVRFFEAREVTRFHASDKYTVFHAEGAEHLTEEPLNELEARLSAHGFLRVHRAELVRLDAVKALRADAEGQVAELSDGQQARVSRRSAGAVRAALGL